MRHVKGLVPHSDYLLVKIDPPLTTKFWDGPSSEYDRIFLAIAGHQNEHDIGTALVMADIVICPTYSEGVLNERKCSRIGVGNLHATYAEALKNSPMEDR